MKNEIEITKNLNSKLSAVDFKNLPFGRIFSDHMFMADYYDGKWQNARIVPFTNISLNPATSALHDGQSIFEGMKAQVDVNGNPILFRPIENAKRFNISAKRMAMPQVPQSLFLGGLEELLRIDSEWIPNEPNTSLYIRPFMFATEEYVGIKPSENFMFIIFTSPVGAYYPKPVSVYISDKYVRAFPGGTGFAKAAGNYAATLAPVMEVKEKGFDQILWIDGIEKKYFQEIGTMNVFFLVNDTLLTPSLEEGTILDGITRDSVIKIAQRHGIKVENRKVSLEEIFTAHRNGSLKDVFGTGTAATISHIAKMGYKDMEFELPAIETRELSLKIKAELDAVKSGKMQDIYNWIYKIDIPVLS